MRRNSPSTVCNLHSNQFLTVYQPRFENGQVSRCTSNGLQLSIYEHTDVVLFLSGQLEIFDLFQKAPKGHIATTWKVTTNLPNTPNFPHEFVRQNLTSERKNTASPKAVPTERTNRRAAVAHIAQRSTSLPASQQSRQNVYGESKSPPPTLGPDCTPASKEESPAPSPGIGEEPPSVSKSSHSALDALVRKVPTPKLPRPDCSLLDGSVERFAESLQSCPRDDTDMPAMKPLDQIVLLSPLSQEP